MISQLKGILSPAPEPKSPDLPPPAPAREQRVHRSAIAAEAAARWEALESEATQLQHSLSVAEARNAVLEQTNQALQNEIASLRYDNERLVRENTAIQERINIAAETLLAIRSGPRTEHLAEQAISEALALDAPSPAATEADAKEPEDAIRN
jgi:FtsZ-binding cell division protein ZapB